MAQKISDAADALVSYESLAERRAHVGAPLYHPHPTAPGAARITNLDDYRRARAPSAAPVPPANDHDDLDAAMGSVISMWLGAGAYGFGFAVGWWLLW